MIGKLNHIAIATPNLKDAAKTYEDLLGAKVGQPIPQMEHGVSVIFIELPNTKIEQHSSIGQTKVTHAQEVSLVCFMCLCNIYIYIYIYIYICMSNTYVMYM